MERKRKKLTDRQREIEREKEQESAVVFWPALQMGNTHIMFVGREGTAGKKTASELRCATLSRVPDVI